VDGHQAHQDAHQDAAPGEWVTIAHAAARLGVSPDAIRRRIRRRTMRARRGIATHGGPPPYLVWMSAEDAAAAPEDGAPGRRQDTRQAHQDGRRDEHHAHQDAARTFALAQARAAEMAAYSQQLLAPYVEKIEAQAELLGAFKERLAAAEARIAELEAPAPETQNGAAEPWPERRRWWQRVLWG
jgi:hypothetical protein